MAPSQRCDLPVNLLRRGCEAEFMEQSEIKVEVNATISSTQVSPRDISITLRPGRQVQSKMEDLWFALFSYCVSVIKQPRLSLKIIILLCVCVCVFACVCSPRFRGQHRSGCEAAGALSCGSVLPGWCIGIYAGKPWSCKWSCQCSPQWAGAEVFHLLLFYINSQVVFIIVGKEQDLYIQIIPWYYIIGT